MVHPFDPSICSHIISDKHWFSENVLCLLSNAIKYSADGTVDLRVLIVENSDLKLRPSANHMVLVSVEDNGIGMLFWLGICVQACTYFETTAIILNIIIIIRYLRRQKRPVISAFYAGSETYWRYRLGIIQSIKKVHNHYYYNYYYLIMIANF